MEVQLRNRFRGMGEMCDPFDTACVERNLVAETLNLPTCIAHPEQCYGHPGYDAYVQAQNDLYLAQVAAGPKIVTPPNPYTEVLWVQKDADGTWHHMGANNRELFVTYTDGSVKASGAPISPILQAQLNRTNQVVQAAAAGLPYPVQTMAPVSPTGFQLPAVFTEEVSIGGSSFPMWAVVAGVAAIGLFFVMGKK